MGLVADYLQKQPDFKPRISKPPDNNLGYIVVVPCNNEKEIITTIESLWNCERPQKSIELIIVVNSSVGAEDSVLRQNATSIEQILDWQVKHDVNDFRVHVITEKNIPMKYAGPGLARKIGMDEAAFRFGLTEKGIGIICSFDADTTCEKNYFVEIEEKIYQNPEIEAGSIYFEHPVSGTQFPEEVYKAISLYELNMRYYLQALRSTGFPYAHHTLGSAFFVGSDAYARFGGMNRRKGGEDFYFLQKVIPNVTFIDMVSTKVIPSPRPSNRVPFGTGPWIYKYINKEIDTYYTYNLKSFNDLKDFFVTIPEMYDSGAIELKLNYHSIPNSLKDFLPEDEFVRKMEEIQENSSHPVSFKKRFYSWFNGFKIIKYLNYIHLNYYERVDVLNEAGNYLREVQEVKDGPLGLSEMLSHYRKMEREIS